VVEEIQGYKHYWKKSFNKNGKRKKFVSHRWDDKNLGDQNKEWRYQDQLQIHTNRPWWLKPFQVHDVNDKFLSKRKVVPLCLITRHTMKNYGGVEVLFFASKTSALHGGEPSASRSGCVTHRERATVTHRKRGCGKDKNVLPLPGV
jgi:hypothetical protein